jgi:hypothetical protein
LTKIKGQKYSILNVNNVSVSFGDRPIEETHPSTQQKKKEHITFAKPPQLINATNNPSKYSKTSQNLYLSILITSQNL